MASDSPRSRAAATILARACHEHLAGAPVIDTIGVLPNPDQATAYFSLTTAVIARGIRARIAARDADLCAAQLLAALTLNRAREGVSLPSAHPRDGETA